MQRGPVRAYLHSARSDFAMTQRLSEEAYLGRACRDSAGPLFLATCGCGVGGLLRVRRAPWMRLVPMVRLYRCLQCGARILRRKLPYRDPYGAVYLQPRRLRPAQERVQEILSLSSEFMRSVWLQ